jgi:surface carbohydrate biosynthesis protein
VKFDHRKATDVFLLETRHPMLWRAQTQPFAPEGTSQHVSIVYLPVELSRRELVARAFLGASLAAHGHDVVVFRLDLFDRVGWPGPGIYIGKSCLPVPPPHDLTAYQRMKAARIKVWHLDEEGGIYRGSDEEAWIKALGTRLDPRVLAAEDKILVWGAWQKDHMEAQGPAASCHVVGSPNFDLYQPKYHGALEDYDARQTGGRSDYILVNTRFTVANALSSFGADHFIHHSLLKKLYAPPTRVQGLANDGVLLYRFIELVGALAVHHPRSMIVLRPHPVENPQLYRAIFQPFDNVLVAPEGDAGAWIRRARLLIHNGCTTAIQAAIAGKPVMTYAPEGLDDELVAGLPNQVGTCVRTRDEALELVRNGDLAADDGAWKRTISHLDSIERLTEMVNNEENQGPKGRPIGAARRLGFRFDMTELPRELARPFFPRRRRHAAGLRTKFDPVFFSSFPEIVGVADSHLRSRSNVKRLSKFAFVIIGAH